MPRRLIATVVPLAVSVIGCWWLVAVTSDRLPERIATHWSGSGGPDGYSSLGSFLTTMAVLGGVFWVLAAILAMSLGPHLRELSGLATGAPGAVAGFFGTMVAMTVLANRDTVGTDAELSTLAVNLPVLGLIVGGVAGALLAGRSPRPELEPGVGQRAGRVLATTLTWSGARWLVAALTVGGLVLVVATKVFVPLLLVPVVAALARYDLTIGPAGVTVRGRLFGWPSMRVPIEEIRAATVVEVRAFRQWGGWGLRISRDGSRGLITRSGAGLELDLADGRRFVVTIDEPDRAAELVASMVTPVR